MQTRPLTRPIAPIGTGSSPPQTRLARDEEPVIARVTERGDFGVLDREAVAPTRISIRVIANCIGDAVVFTLFRRPR